jgi:hypothetical protein
MAYYNILPERCGIQIPPRAMVRAARVRRGDCFFCWAGGRGSFFVSPVPAICRCDMKKTEDADAGLIEKKRAPGRFCVPRRGGGGRSIICSGDRTNGRTTFRIIVPSILRDSQRGGGRSARQAQKGGGGGFQTRSLAKHTRPVPESDRGKRHP